MARRSKRPELHTRQELEDYLLNNADTELPFLEECWNRAVELCKANEGKNQQIIEKKVTDRDGNEVISRRPVSNVITNPVTQYFKLMGLAQYRKKAQAIRDEEEISNINEPDSILSADDAIYFENEVHNDEVTAWIKSFNPVERDYMIKRYTSYFDQYEINDGADKTLLKRILSLEIALHRIDTKRAAGKLVDINDEKKLSDQLQSTLESMKWTKKQRNAREDMAQNKFTVWMDKQVSEGEFKVEKKEYEKDEIDFLIDTILNSTREMLS
jgi:hypothetical protein